MYAQRSYARYTITSALIYANGPLHIGHLAGCLLPADIYARYLRLQGREVCFLGGTDEHGVPITIQAHREQRTPRQIVDTYHLQIKSSLDEIGISFDVFDRTTDELHCRVASDFFLSLYEQGYFEQRTSEQYYDVEKGCFLADRYISGRCSYCGYERAYGDQCEHCGRTLAPEELEEPRSVFGGTIERRGTHNWYLPLGRWQKELEAYIDEQQHWRKSVRAQCQSWLKEGLHSRAMTRDLDWGIPVPLPDAEGKVLYVWFDAPIGYISATQKHLPDRWKSHWQDKETRLVHFIGKDNIVFHCLIFPLMLMLRGEYILPSDVPANEFMNLEGEKISTSRGWAIWLHEYLRDFPGQQDALRYALTALMPDTKDSNFTWKAFQSYINNEVVGVLGNFLHRVLHLAKQYTNSRVPDVSSLSSEDNAALRATSTQMKQIATSIEAFRFREALSSMMEIARIGNKYIADQAPWAAETSKQRRDTQIYTALQLAAQLSIAMEPFLPFSAQRLRAQLNLKPQKWTETSHLIPSGHPLEAPSTLFSKIDDSVIEQQLQKLKSSMHTSSTPTPSEPESHEIGFETFAEIEMRVGTVLRCEAVPKSKKLLRLIINDGHKERVILSGIAAYYKPQSLVGTQIIFVGNLKPRKIMGEISEGMILSAVSGDTLRFLQPDELIHAGAEVC